jgi:hypothetical protein
MKHTPRSTIARPMGRARWIGGGVAVLLAASVAVFYFAFLPDILVDERAGAA